MVCSIAMSVNLLNYHSIYNNWALGKKRQSYNPIKAIYIELVIYYALTGALNHCIQVKS